MLAGPRARLGTLLGLDRVPRLRAVLNWGITMLLVVLAWVFFRATDVHQAFAVLKGIVLFDGRLQLSAFAAKGGLLTPAIGVVLIGLLALSYRLPYDLRLRHPRRFIVAATLLIILLGSNGGEFIYFQF